MKKILISVFAIVAVAAVAGVASWAYWSDSEGSNGNSIMAGSLDLVLNGIPINITNAYPGQSQSQVLEVKNEGTIAGSLVFAIDNVKNLENICIEPELNDASPADETCGTGDDQGELGAHVQVSVSVRPHGTGTYTHVIGPMSLDVFADTDLSGFALPMAAGDDFDVKVDWTVDNTTPASDDIFMTDSFEADFTATLTQN